MVLTMNRPRTPAPGAPAPHAASMAGFVHYYTHVPGRAAPALRTFGTSAREWLGATPLGGDAWLLPLEPDGLLGGAETLDVRLRVGPCTVTPVGLLRRVAFRVPGLCPEVRCDLTLEPSLAHGCRLRLRGDYRPPLTTDGQATADEIVEAFVRPLVERVAERLLGATLPL